MVSWPWPWLICCRCLPSSMPPGWRGSRLEILRNDSCRCYSARVLLMDVQSGIPDPMYSSCQCTVLASVSYQAGNHQHSLTPWYPDASGCSPKEEGFHKGTYLEVFLVWTGRPYTWFCIWQGQYQLKTSDYVKQHTLHMSSRYLEEQTMMVPRANCHHYSQRFPYSALQSSSQSVSSWESQRAPHNTNSMPMLLVLSLGHIHSWQKTWIAPWIDNQTQPVHCYQHNWEGGEKHKSWLTEDEKLFTDIVILIPTFPETRGH